MSIQWQLNFRVTETKYVCTSRLAKLKGRTYPCRVRILNIVGYIGRRYPSWVQNELKIDQNTLLPNSKKARIRNCTFAKFAVIKLLQATAGTICSSNPSLTFE